MTYPWQWIGPVLLVALAGCLKADDPSGPGNPNADLVCTIPTEHIFSTGVGRDGIPALDHPGVGGMGEIPFGLTGDDRVLGVVRNGVARAYPLPVMWWHEIVNDSLGGEPLLVTYCPLTGSGIAFDPRIDGGAARRFGVSGSLYRTNLTMIDRETESLWNQMLLGSQCGVDRGKGLTRVPVIETTLDRFLTLHPEGTVVGTATGFVRNYDQYPYGDYDTLENEQVRWLPPGVTWGDARPAKEMVLGVFDGWNDARDCRQSAGCFAKLWPFEALAERGAATVLNDEVGDRPVAVTFVREVRQAIAYDRQLDDAVLTFSMTSAVPFLMQDAETGTVWDEGGRGIEGPHAGRQLTRVEESYAAFWFAWSVYFRNADLAIQ